ncbi:Hydrogenase transcriptional regulatory protein HoxA [Enhygromyxa salina]|uniref:Hydrogenase transcriptional regulatory protein HoxA n=1 Tax=Enhygromyxa salina TaxID=215803 RepID=A0A0C1ZPC1_9BACT|nr:Hydrogenase transcriptional regulatory protein HoxA [Enhygromyxa salina]
MIYGGKPERAKVLVVDDELYVLESIMELLRRDYCVLATTEAEEAIQVLAAEDIALLLTDQRMPRVSGVELLARAAQIRPETVRVLFTGYSDVEAVIRGVNEGHMYRYVTKPWDPAELLALVAETTMHHEQAVARRQLVRELVNASPSELARCQTQTPAQAQTWLEIEDPIAQENALLRAVLHQFASFWQVRKSGPVLPICMTCRKVNAGSGVWTDLLDFMHEHSTFLSHGYCPACAREQFALAGLDPDEHGHT